jgi:hypothetical protein
VVANDAYQRMSSTTLSWMSKLDARQAVKLTIYSLLLINFFFYLADDLTAASYTMRNGGSLLDWTASFATTIDESAWFVLLFLFEMETYVLSDEVQARPLVMRLIHGIRLLCYIFLLHSIYAFGTIYYDLTQVTVIPGVSSPCELLAAETSFVRNLEYTDLTNVNCASLSSNSDFYYTEPGLVISDAEGWALETRLALVDLLEVIVWLLILLTIEIMVRLQDKSITGGAQVTVIKFSKYLLYTSLWLAAAWWASLGHYYFAWDEALWIVGFFAIEMNMNDWKKDIEAEQGITSTG